jgi:hypothetical protein
MQELPPGKDIPFAASITTRTATYGDNRAPPAPIVVARSRFIIDQLVY